MIQNVRVVCDPSLIETTGRIIRTCVTGRRPLDMFVYGVGNEIAFELAQGRRIILVGLSYGGSVVNHVLEYLNDFVRAICNSSEQFVAITFGTIYVANDADVSNCRLFNFMYADDVARRCFNRNNAVKQNSFIGLENPTNTQFYRNYQLRKMFMFLGTSEEWTIHNNYTDLMISIINDIRLRNYDLLEKWK